MLELILEISQEQLSDGVRLTYETYQFGQSSVDHTASIEVIGKDSRGRTVRTIGTMDEIVKGYSKPNIRQNVVSNNTYVSRVQEDGTIDGFGEYGFLHLTWDVVPINLDDPNLLVSATVILNDEISLTPSSGSIAEGYIDYIFPLGLTLNGNLEIVLTDDLSSSSIKSQIVPKASMAMSLFDNGQNVWG